MLAYWALCCSATDPWINFDIDRAIVVPDWEGEVTARMKYIKPNYTSEIGIRTVKINHVDGAGMILPDTPIVPEGLNRKNFMIRSNYIKGLLSSFDYIRFCEVHGIEPIVKDFWGKEWHLKNDRIYVILTASQFKLASRYSSWQEYKDAYKESGCHFGITQFEEDEIPDKNFNYQMLGCIFGALIW